MANEKIISTHLGKAIHSQVTTRMPLPKVVAAKINGVPTTVAVAVRNPVQRLK